MRIRLSYEPAKDGGIETDIVAATDAGVTAAS